MCLAWQYGQLDLRGHLNPQHTATISTRFIVIFSWSQNEKNTAAWGNVKFQLNSFFAVYAQFHYGIRI